MFEFKPTRRALLAGAAATLAAPSLARAQDAFPNKQIKFVVPWTPGGATDNISRIVTAKMSELLGQQVLIDNRAGGGGTIGTDAIAKAAPDGYTIGLITVSMFCMAPALYAKLPYDPVKDFSPMAGMSVWPNMLVVHPSVPAKTVPELIALLKANPGKYNMASSGSGTTIHLAGEMFKQLTGTDMVHVPYKGSAGAMQDLIAGNVHIMFDNMPSCWPHVQAGKLRALGVAGPERAFFAPELPLLRDMVNGFDLKPWHGLMAPAGTPPAIVNKISEEVQSFLRTPAAMAKLQAMGVIRVGNSAAEFQSFMAAEFELYKKIIQDAGIKAE